MRSKFLVAVLILLLPLVNATEYVGNLDTNIDSQEEPPQQESTPTASGEGGGSSGSSSDVDTNEEKTSTEDNIITNNAPVQDESEDTIDSTEIRELGKLPAEFSLDKNSAVSFIIDDEGSYYFLWPSTIKDDYFSFVLNSKPNPTTESLKTSETKKFDLDGDGSDDISVLLIAISDGKVYLKMEKLNPSLVNQLTAAAVGVADNGGWLAFAAGLVVVVSSLAGIKLYKGKKKLRK